MWGPHREVPPGLLPTYFISRHRAGWDYRLPSGSTDLRKCIIKLVCSLTTMHLGQDNQLESQLMAHINWLHVDHGSSRDSVHVREFIFAKIHSVLTVFLGISIPHLQPLRDAMKWGLASSQMRSIACLRGSHLGCIYLPTYIFWRTTWKFFSGVPIHFSNHSQPTISFSSQ